MALYEDQQSKMKQQFDKKRREVDDQKFTEGQLVLLQVKNQPRTQLATPGSLERCGLVPTLLRLCYPMGCINFNYLLV